MNNSTRNPIRAIAFYLPQYHPIPENDAWWGKGFTEWTNVTKAKPLYRGHEQPNLPGELGFYDLRLENTRIEQANLAKSYGIEGFCYWHYWFGNGKKLLELPLNEMLYTRKPNFPFCLAWANESWTGIWHGMEDNVLAKQEYPGLEDYRKHFYNILPAFKDARYIKLNEKPIFLVYRPHKIPDTKEFTSYWNQLAVKEGLAGIHFIAIDQNNDFKSYGFDGIVPNSPTPVLAKIKRSLVERLILKLTKINIASIYQRINGKPTLVDYKKFVNHNDTHQLELNEYPVILPGWDNTPRSGSKGLVLTNSTPELFEEHTNKTISRIIHKPLDNRFLFIKSWNEWAEGNVLEPTAKNGFQYLEAFKKSADKFRI
ncbi:hypothetical protein A5893_14410 [Pedobacter psychrophilus]|uniref:Lipopolysaccharide biosynthesis protein n=1 Tax=Pedobacter psychrophilus TaxID=1826909 RepID=A0A179DCV2_9SPHI|nr:glycoside hydrolase family 99-like domain-containing protein [Pedobacter psychrophilus]OAQ38602.1 hypothetical protein A5893_14410 [Pedobacter psychrophilus]